MVINYLQDLEQENTKKTHFIIFFRTGDNFPNDFYVKSVWMIPMVLYLSNHTPGTRWCFECNQESKSHGKIWLWEIPEWNKMTHLSHCQCAQ